MFSLLGEEMLSPPPSLFQSLIFPALSSPGVGEHIHVCIPTSTALCRTSAEVSEMKMGDVGYGWVGKESCGAHLDGAVLVLVTVIKPSVSQPVP